MERSLEDSFQLLHMDDVMTDLNTDSAASEEGLAPPRKRRRWRAVLLGLIILVSGMLIGSGGTVFVTHNLSEAVFRDRRCSLAAHCTARRQDANSSPCL